VIPSKEKAKSLANNPDGLYPTQFSPLHPVDVPGTQCKLCK